MLQTGKAPAEIVKEKGLEQVSDTSALQAIVVEVMANNQKSIDDYKNGKTNALGFLARAVHEGLQRKGKSCFDEGNAPEISGGLKCRRLKLQICV